MVVVEQNLDVFCENLLIRNSISIYMKSREIFINQLRRQARWLSQSRSWIIREKIKGAENIKSALDVGCGPGFIMKELENDFGFSSVGIDKDPDMIKSAEAQNLDVLLSDGHKLPFSDSSFDLVHCTFTIMWLDDPISALKEMKRVSKCWVVCFAEPDYGARVDFPDKLSELPWIIGDGIKRDGGNPYTGRRLRGYFSFAGLDPKIGVYDSVWSLEQLESEFKDEWDFLRASVISEHQDLDTLEKEAKSAIELKTRMQFTPIFYAVAHV
jgi:SAM-dependent methyltransferase